MTTANEVTIPFAEKCVHYNLKGHHGWWKRISKAEAKDDKFAQKAIYGNDSLGWFVPVDLGRSDGMLAS